MKSIRVDVDSEKHQLVKIALAAKGMTIAEWIRIKVDKLIEGKDV